MPVSIAVVIPTYNVEKYIEATLKSVYNQTVAADEIIVVDNGSTDKTVELVRQFPAAFFSETTKRGAGATRNRGIAEAQSQWIAFLDGDDQFFPEKIQSLKEAIAKNKEAIFFAHDEVEGPLEGPFKEKKLHEYYDPTRPLLPQLFERCFLSTSTMAVRRDVLLEIKGFNEEFMVSQDYELWMRLAQKGPLQFIPKTLALYLLRPNSISENIALRLQYVLRIVERYRGEVSTRIYLNRVIKLYGSTVLALLQKRRWASAIRVLGGFFVRLPHLLLGSSR